MDQPLALGACTPQIAPSGPPPTLPDPPPSRQKPPPPPPDPPHRPSQNPPPKPTSKLPMVAGNLHSLISQSLASLSDLVPAASPAGVSPVLNANYPPTNRWWDAIFGGGGGARKMVGMPREPTARLCTGIASPAITSLRVGCRCGCCTPPPLLREQHHFQSNNRCCFRIFWYLARLPPGWGCQGRGWGGWATGNMGGDGGSREEPLGSRRQAASASLGLSTPSKTKQGCRQHREDLIPRGTLSLRRAVWVTFPEDRRNRAAYIHTFFTYRLPPPSHTTFFSYLIDIPLFGPLCFTNGAFDSVPDAVWAHKMVVVEEPPLILFLGTPRRQGLCSHSALFWAPEKGGVR